MSPARRTSGSTTRTSRWSAARRTRSSTSSIHLLLGGPFRLIGFADAAQVYGPGQPFDLSRLRYSAGAEVRIFVPVFGAPLRFIYAKNLKPLPDDDFQSFQFSIGTTF